MRKNTLGSAWLTVLAVLALLTAGAVHAQVAGLYYMEVEKDGRVYVFNTPERYQAWSAGRRDGHRDHARRARRGRRDAGRRERDRGRPLPLQAQPARLRPHDAEAAEAVRRAVFYKDGKTNFVMKTGTVQISNRLQGLLHPEQSGGRATPSAPSASAA